MANTLMVGIVYAVAADLVWGLAFVIPKFLHSYSAVEIAFGRYLTYGVASLFLFLANKKNVINIDLWMRALIFAFCGNIGYYYFLVLAIKLTGATIPTLVIGLLPITISLYGNWLNREFSFTKILPSLGLLLSGIVIFNYSQVVSNKQELNYYGVVCSLIALAFWTWYGVANALFLKDNPQITPTDWANVVGVATLGLLSFLIMISGLFYSESFTMYKFYDYSNLGFWVGSTILGIIVTWVGGIFWNKASQLLPVTLAGQMIVGETIFGLAYGYLVEVRMPYYLEWFGIIIVIGGVLISIRIINRLKGVTLDSNA